MWRHVGLRHTSSGNEFKLKHLIAFIISVLLVQHICTGHILARGQGLSPASDKWLSAKVFFCQISQISHRGLNLFVINNVFLDLATQNTETTKILIFCLIFPTRERLFPNPHYVLSSQLENLRVRGILSHPLPVCCQIPLQFYNSCLQTIRVWLVHHSLCRIDMA